MSLGGSEQTGVQTTTVLPPAYVLPQLAYGANEAQRMYSAGTGFGYYPENTVAGFSPEQQMAMTLQGNRALSGSPITREGQSLGLNTLRGDFLGSNPYFKQAVLDPITDQVQGQFSRAGRLGSGANQNALTRALSTPLMQNYENERQRQNNMLANVPALANQDYTDYAQLAAVGLDRQQQAQRQIEANKSRFDFLQSAPQQRLGTFLGNLNAAAGQGQTTNQPLYENTNANALANTATLLGIIKELRG
tara:strand:- start:2053 stop:2796 length:744 start_codon:yes stop_codon:yes gene_type:complete